MKSIKKITIMLVVLTITLAMNGCNSEETTVEKNQREVESIVEEVVDKQEKIVKDGLGREVVIPTNPERILALNSTTMEALFNLGITPIGKVQNYEIREEGIALPNVGPPGNVNIEAIHKLQPDLIIAHTRHHGAMVEALEGTGAAVFYHNPESGDVAGNHVLEFLGELLDKEEATYEYIDAINALAEELKEEIAKKTDIKTAIIIRDGDTITAAQRATGYGVVLQLLGIENIVPDNLPDASKESFVNFDIETILQENPDLVFVMTASDDEAYNQQVLQQYQKDPKWIGLNAVKNDRLILLPFGVNPNRSTREDMLKLTVEAILTTEN